MTLAPVRETTYRKRRQQLIRHIQGDAALFCAAVPQHSSRDLERDYRQDSDFFYFTGFTEPDSALLLLGTTSSPKSILWVKERDKSREQWTGERLGVSRAKRRFKVDQVRDIADFQRDLVELLRGAEALHWTAGTHEAIDALLWKNFKTLLGPRATFPRAICDARVLTSEMRFVKDTDEIRVMREAAQITAEGFIEIAPVIERLSNEDHTAKVLESCFAHFGSEGLAFPTIVAVGKNATTLHHVPTKKPLKKNELLLIDAGATYGGYAADISRTFPVSGKFSPAQAEIYDIVHAALVAATRKAKPGATMDLLHNTAVRVIVQGLIRLKILKGSVAKNISSGKYKRYFMHRTGHFLGLDTHDINPLYFPKPHLSAHSYSRPLVAGNAFTIEPGLYFDANDTTVPKRYRGIGVRIEDDVLITRSGHEVLTRGVPSERADIEALMDQSMHFGDH